MKKKNFIDSHGLSTFDSSMLYAIGCLCSEGAVSLHSFTEIFSPEKTHEIVHSIEGFALQGHLKYFDDVIYGPLDNYWKSKSLSDSLMQEILQKLLEKTTISIYQDRLHVRDYFLMSYSFAKHIERTTYNIDYTIFAGLVCNLALFDIWYPQNFHAERTEDIPIVRIMTLAMNKIASDSPLVSRLNSHISLIFTNAWHYDIALNHLKIAEENDISFFGAIKDSTCLAYAEYYYTYGLLAVSLKYYRMAVEMTEANDEYIRVYCSAKIGLILALLGDGVSCQKWLGENCQYFSYIPHMHEIYVIYCMIQSLLADTCDEALEYLDQAELILSRLNHCETPTGCMLHYIRSQVWSVYGFPLKSLGEYRKYVVSSISDFKPADGGEGGWAILFSGRIRSYLDRGSLTTAKKLSIRELDSIIDIYSSTLAFSVRSEICHAYVQLYKDKLFPLALTYNQIYEDLRKLYKPSQKVLQYIAPLFAGDIPTSITLDTAWETAFEQLHIEISMSEQRQSDGKTVDDIRKRIDELRLQYPELNSYLMIAEGRLDTRKDIRKAIETWKKAIDNADDGELFWIARESAKWCAYYGGIYDAVDMYKIAIDSETFEELSPSFKFDCLLEYVSLVEKCGFRSDAQVFWNQLEEMAMANDEELPWLYYNRALIEFDHEQWETCRLFLLEFFAIYKQTEQFDELLSSAYCYYCSVQTRFGEYEAGLQAIKRSMALWIDQHTFEIFPLYCNKAHCEIGLGEWADARKTLKQAEKFVGGSAENKQILDDLYDFLQEQRNNYSKTK